MYFFQSQTCGGCCSRPFYSVLFAVFLWSDDKHGTVGVMQYVVGHGPEDRAAQLTHPTGPHHDPRGALGLRHGAQRLTRPLEVLVVLKRNLKMDKNTDKPSYWATALLLTDIFWNILLVISFYPQIKPPVLLEHTLAHFMSPKPLHL